MSVLDGHNSEKEGRRFLPLMHKKDVRTARHIRVDGHGEDEFIVFPVEVVKVVL